jgi:hypothetical protein
MAGKIRRDRYGGKRYGGKLGKDIYGGKDTMRKIWREKMEEKIWREVRYGTVRYDPIVSIRAAGLIKIRRYLPYGLP